MKVDGAAPVFSYDIRYGKISHTLQKTTISVTILKNNGCDIMIFVEKSLNLQSQTNQQ